MSMPLAHYVSEEAFDPEATVAPGSAPSERYLRTPRRGRSSGGASCGTGSPSISLIFLGAQLRLDPVTELLAPYDLHSRHTDFIYAPPQRAPPLPRGAASSGRSSIRSTSSSTWTR